MKIRIGVYCIRNLIRSKVLVCINSVIKELSRNLWPINLGARFFGVNWKWQIIKGFICTFTYPDGIIIVSAFCLSSSHPKCRRKSFSLQIRHFRFFLSHSCLDVHFMSSFLSAFFVCFVSNKYNIFFTWKSKSILFLSRISKWLKQMKKDSLFCTFFSWFYIRMKK